MADVFLSYAQEDRTRARQLADTLRERGWDVWWDAHVYVGTRFRAEITRQLQSAKCVVVLWSQASIESDWVIDEAEDGKNRGVLVQALIDAAQPPHGFRGIQWANLNSWSGDTHAEEFVKLAGGISRFAPVAIPTPSGAAHAQQDSPAHIALDSRDKAPKARPLQWRIATDRFIAVLAKRRRIVIAGLGVAIAAAMMLYVSGIPAERAPQTAQFGSDKPVVPSSSSAAPSADASPGQNGGNNSAPTADRLPSAEAPSSPPRSPATTSAPEGAKPPPSDVSSSAQPTTTRQTDWWKPLQGKVVLETPSSTTTPPSASTSATEGAKPPASDGSQRSTPVQPDMTSLARPKAPSVSQQTTEAAETSQDSSLTCVAATEPWKSVFRPPFSSLEWLVDTQVTSVKVWWHSYKTGDTYPRVQYTAGASALCTTTRAESVESNFGPGTNPVVFLDVDFVFSGLHATPKTVVGPLRRKIEIPFFGSIPFRVYNVSPYTVSILFPSNGTVLRTEQRFVLNVQGNPLVLQPNP